MGTGKRLTLCPALALFLLAACTTVRTAPPAPAVAPNASEMLSLMTYNVENLFDTEDDPDKNDDAFLPASVKSDPIFQNRCRTRNTDPHSIAECLNRDWSQARLERKMRRLADVVGQVGEGRGPDILILQEVESLKVLTQWRDQFLGAMNYGSLAYVKGPDERGINPAVFSRLPLLEPPVLHEIDFTSLAEKPRPSRGILESHFGLPNGETLIVFALHFPSQAATTPFRLVAVRRLLEVAAGLPANANVVVGGDFNVTGREELAEKIFSGILAEKFTVSHLVGCRKCVGTVYFPPDRTWSFFDALLFSPTLTQTGTAWKLNPESIRTINSSRFQIGRFGDPARFGNGNGTVGVSDHWPVYAEIHHSRPTQIAITGESR